jgi:hypothetical protein
MSTATLGTDAYARRMGAGNPPAPASPSDAANTVRSIAAYIPSDVLTVYVAIVAALASTTTDAPSAWVAFALFLVASPLAVWLVYAGQWKASQSKLPISPRERPRWEMTASAIAFFAWAFALPETPFSSFSWYNPAIAGVVVLLVVTSLGLLRPLFIVQSAAPPGPPNAMNEQPKSRDG